MLCPGQIEISTIAHGIGSLDERMSKIRVFPAGMDIRCAPFKRFRVFVDQTGNLSKEFINDIVFGFHLFPPQRRQQKTP